MKNRLLKIFFVALMAIASFTSTLQAKMIKPSAEQEIADIEEYAGASIEQMQEDFKNQEVSDSQVIETKPIAQAYSVRSAVETSDYIYLSDEPRVSSSVGYGSLQINKNINGGKITLTVGGVATVFEKGLGAHAKSTIVYDISKYKDTYTRVSAYAGVDRSQLGKGDGVNFFIFGSNSLNSNWVQLATSGKKIPADEAYFFDIDVSQYKYIKLEARIIGYNGNDHAVYGDLRLLKTDYDLAADHYDGVQSVAAYDAQLSANTIEDNFANHKLLVLQREFVNRIGYQNIQSIYRYRPQETKQTLDWILQDQETLQLFIEAGKYFSGTGYNALDALIRLYTAHKDDTHTLIYKKMLLATAAAYSKRSRTFLTNYGGNYEESDPVIKYELMKKLYDDGRFIRQQEFESYPMELIRTVMDAKINDSEILWLRDYIDKKYPNTSDWKRFNGYGYTKYKQPNYGNAKYYSEENFAQWDEKYDFSKYGISYGTKNLFRIWMLIEDGAICWGLSGLGIAVNEVQGIAAFGTYQPGHEAFLTYSTNADGKGIWKINDDIAGWTKSYTRWGSTTATEYRIPLEWGVQSYNKVDGGYNTSYLLLSQDALNDYSNYLNSMYYNLIANSYTLGSKNYENALKRSLQAYDKNLDSFYQLYQSLAANQTTSDAEWSTLAKEIMNAYTYFPAPMVDLVKLIRAKIKDETKKIEIDVLQTKTLQTASKATAKESIQDTACRNLANYFLGNSSVKLATFSFDGEYANQICINEAYNGSLMQIRVSLDGGHTWEMFGDKDYTTEHSITLSEEQIKKITAENDIVIGLMGTTTTYRIDIQNGTNVAEDINLNDYENRLYGTNVNKLEYSEDGGTTWLPYFVNEQPVLMYGNKTILVRTRANGTTLVGNPKAFTFTNDANTERRTYVPLNHLSLAGVSTQLNNNTPSSFILDGNARTAWHNNSKNETKAEKRWFSVKLDTVRMVSALEYASPNTNGKLKRGSVYVSLDGTNWTKVMQTNVFANDTSIKKIEFPQTVAARYIKIVGDETYGNPSDSHFTCAIFRVFEDTTQQYSAQPTITYSTVDPTKENVTATLSLPEGCHAQEDTYLFTENGTHTFIYTDANDIQQQIDAKVDWIDRIAPTAQIEYSTTVSTNGQVIATLQEISETNVEILSEGGNTHTFDENGIFVFWLRDQVGNETKIEAKVDWIDRIAPHIGVIFDKQQLTNQSVTATLTDIEEGDRILGDGSRSHVFAENGTYVFKVMDAAGNIAQLPVSVDWIDKKQPVGVLSYSTQDPTTGAVIVSLKDLNKQVKFLDGSDGTMIFNQNGTYVFHIQDAAGNENEYVATVDWIKEQQPEIQDKEEQTEVEFNSDVQTDQPIMEAEETQFMQEETTLPSTTEENRESKQTYQNVNHVTNKDNSGLLVAVGITALCALIGYVIVFIIRKKCKAS